VFCFFLLRFRFLFFGPGADALGSSESPAGVSGRGRGRFLPATFREERFSGVGSAVLVTNGRLVDEPVPAFVSTVAVVAGVVPVRGSLPRFDFLFFLVATACPAVMVNRALGHEKKRVV